MSSATCEFCDEAHPNGIERAYTDLGHPYLAAAARGGFAWFSNGREMTAQEIERAKAEKTGGGKAGG